MTTKLLLKRDGRYAAIHVTRGGHVDGIGRVLFEHYADPDRVAALFAAADAEDSRSMHRLAPPYDPVFDQGERRLSPRDFAADELGRWMANYTFFIFHDGIWRWADADVAQRTAEADATGNTFDEDAVIALTTPLAEAVEAERRARLDDRAARDAVVAAAQTLTFSGLWARLASHMDGSTTIQIHTNTSQGFETMEPDDVAAFGHALLVIAEESRRRNAERNAHATAG